MTKAIETLSQFNLAETDDGYLLEIGGSGGGSLTLAASAEQIDAIIEALDALLSDDDDAIED
jgi:cephalosporin-C deacetylase-like acetyl esterase